jgi:hypothetical protein
MKDEQRYWKLKSISEKRELALKYITNEKEREMIKFDKIAETTIDILFAKRFNQKYEVKRKYVAKYKDDNNY